MKSTQAAVIAHALQIAATFAVAIALGIHVDHTRAHEARTEARFVDFNRERLDRLEKQLADQDPEARIHQLQDATHDLRGRVGEIERRLAQPWYFYPASPYPPYRR